MRAHRTALTAALAAVAIAGVAGLVEAATTCTFTTAGKIMRLDADCTTDETIFIPSGGTLDGQGHTITAVDPPGGAFLAPILRNAGPVAHVRNVTLTASDLTNQCEPDDAKLRAILFDGASGSITGNTILNVNKSGQGSCSNQGANILVRKPPFDGSHPAAAKVTIRDNQVMGFSQLGVSLIGDVRATVSDNTLQGLGGAGISQSGQFGVAVQNGALATVSRNSIQLKREDPLSPNAFGVYVFDSNQAQITGNTLTGGSHGIFVEGTCISAPSSSRNLLAANVIRASALGIGLVAREFGTSTCPPEVNDNVVRGNDIQTPSGVTGQDGIALLTLGDAVVDGNIIKGNTIGGFFNPIFQSGDTNTIIQGNTVLP